ncbi:hypothetical protein EVAR_90501_1 [Eumeta japonica]|uniref:Reverse transcriptase domain-containing protein n=1 Tax=Eumeta variegata TaxID=151549 RepID=A0A4C2AB14_EUMVA|nr:hypothetical protein EVAR_90501_1 [Eumeta japonica]
MASPQRGTEDALYDLMTHIYRVKSQKIVLMVSLDIEGAFDNAWWPALETQLRALAAGEPPWPGPRLPSGPGVVVKYAGGQERDFKGLYTRFYSRSNLWNLILDSLLENSGNSAYTCRRSRMMWSSCSPDSRLRRSGGQPRSSSRALLGSQK